MNRPHLGFGGSRRSVYFRESTPMKVSTTFCSNTSTKYAVQMAALKYDPRGALRERHLIGELPAAMEIKNWLGRRYLKLPHILLPNVFAHTFAQRVC